MWGPSITTYTFFCAEKKGGSVTAEIAVLHPTVYLDALYTGLPNGVSLENAVLWYAETDLIEVNTLNSINEEYIDPEDPKVGFGVTYEVNQPEQYKALYGFLQVVDQYEISLSYWENNGVVELVKLPQGVFWLDGQKQEDQSYASVIFQQRVSAGLLECNIGYADAPGVYGRPRYASKCDSHEKEVLGQYEYKIHFINYFMMRVMDGGTNNNWVPIKKFKWDVSYKALCEQEDDGCGLGLRDPYNGAWNVTNIAFGYQEDVG